MHNPYEITSRKPRHRENSIFVVLQVRGSGQLPVHLLLVLLVLVVGKRVRCAVRCYCELAASAFFWTHPCRNHGSGAPEREFRGNAAIEHVDKNSIRGAIHRSKRTSCAKLVCQDCTPAFFMSCVSASFYVYFACCII